MYGIHPALPSYLAQQWCCEEPDDHPQQRSAAATALLDAYAALGRWLLQQIISGDAAFAFSVLDRQKRTLGNLLANALDTGQWNQAQAIAQPLNEYWDTRGLYDEARGWVDRAHMALETTDGTPPLVDDPARELWLYFAYSQANRQLTAHYLDDAERTYLDIRDMLQAHPESPQQLLRLADIYHQLGRVAELRGRWEEAEEWYRQALTIKEEFGNRSGMAGSYHHLGIVAQFRGRLEEAEEWYRQSLAIKEELGDRPGMAGSYHQLGVIAQRRARLEDAEQWYRQALTINEELGNRPVMAMSFVQLGLLAETRGRPEEAMEWMVRCVTLFDEFPRPMTERGPTQLARLTAELGIDTLNESGIGVTDHPLPPEVQNFTAPGTGQDEK